MCVTIAIAPYRSLSLSLSLSLFVWSSHSCLLAVAKSSSASSGKDGHKQLLALTELAEQLSFSSVASFLGLCGVSAESGMEG